MLIRYLIIFLILIFHCQSENKADLLRPRNASAEFEEYTSLIENNNIVLDTNFERFNEKKKQLEKSHQRLTNLILLDSTIIKKVIALSVFSRLYNPLEINNIKSNYYQEIRKLEESGNRVRITKSYTVVRDYFRYQDIYNSLKFKDKHILFDLYNAPFIFIGNIIDCDSVIYDKYGHTFIKCDLMITDNLNPYYTEDIIGKILSFAYFPNRNFDILHSSYHGPLNFITPEKIRKERANTISIEGFKPGKKYLVFISADFFESIKIKNKPCPILYMTSYLNSYSLCDGDTVFDKSGYFGAPGKISIEEVKNKIFTVFQQLDNWRNEP